MKQEDNPTKIPYYSYIFSTEGKIYNKKGKELKTDKYKSGTRCITLYLPIDSTGCTKKVKLSVAKKLYELYYGITLDKDMVIDYLDQDPDNWCIKNLYVKKKKNDIMTAEQVLEIRNLYFNHDKHMCNVYNKDSYSIRELAAKYNVSHNVIQKILNQLDIKVPLIIVSNEKLEHIVGHHSFGELFIERTTGGIHYKDEILKIDTLNNENGKSKFKSVITEEELKIQYVPLELYQYLILNLDSVSKKGEIAAEIEKWYKKIERKGKNEK